MKGFSLTPRKAPAEVVHGVRVEMTSVVAARVNSLLGAVENRNSKGSIVHRCSSRTMVSTGEGRRSRVVQHALLEIMPNSVKAGLLVRTCSVLESQLPCTLSTSAHPRGSDSTCAAGIKATRIPPNVIAY